MNPKNELVRCAPEAQGVSSEKLLAFVEALDRSVNEMHSLMLLRGGAVVAEGWWKPYAPARPHVLWSLSKSFTSTAVGLAVGEGRLSLHDTVISFFPEAAPAKVSPNLAAMRVRDLLAMASGHQTDASDRTFSAPDGDWVRAFLSLPVENKPGTHFVYNTAATYMASAIVQKVTGQRVVDYLQPRLFDPLGIEPPFWEVCPRGINTGGFGLRLKTEDIARFGQLYLQKGVWAGRRILPEGWVEAASALQTSNGSNPVSDWEQGYGYQFWRCRHNAYRGDGAFGQYCVVLPEQDAVLVITAGVEDMQPPLNLAWDVLLPAFAPAPLPPRPAAQAALEAKLRSLALPLPQGEASSPAAARVSGRVYRFEPNRLGVKSARFDFDAAGGCLFTLEGMGGADSLACGAGEWREGVTAVMAMPPAPGAAPRPQLAAACGAWSAPGVYRITQRFIETPAHLVLTCRFSGGRVTISGEVLRQFGPRRLPRLEGKA